MAPQSAKTRGAYTPSVPSPLNPNPESESPGRGDGCSTSRSELVALAARKPSGPTSPTQRLMRQKAAVAWRSMAIQQHQQEQEARFWSPPYSDRDSDIDAGGGYAGSSYEIFVMGDEVSSSVDVTDARLESLDVKSAENDGPPTPIPIPIPLPRDCDVEGAGPDVEKLSLVVDQNDLLERNSDPAIVREVLPEPVWYSGAVSKRRVLVLIGLLFVIGAWSAIHTGGHSRGS
ncbi:hypothetical protein DL766_006191 [Monosporascus sp. MC13-8B]|uniref:Uncharacterized protein n=1 Tax=Monosporascus cannonballus TaxID=155416 RepID=A0ABY0GW70_9PEZI|nr:hypothetical protein DL762_008545 [Monosporascus cannonballus]RYO79700.1 hypothetical protein DL763_009170 [Monosporascus cannonballus]RYP27816.1 hypothetical protein DL766_006191 [Monosporascus sp. MC13-8B]